VFVGGRVLTMDAQSSIASALAVTNGVIVAVGDHEQLQPLIGPDTRVIDLVGRTLLPGINDAHCHAMAFGLDRPPFNLDLSYPTVKSIADIAKAVKDATRSLEPGQWIVGSGWDSGFLDECVNEPGRLPTRHDLDSVSPNNPVYLQDFSYHTAWVNTLALERASYDHNTVPPTGATIEREPDGFPTGYVTEGARYPIRDLLPTPTHEMRMSAARSAIATMNALGITSLTEPGIGPGDAGGGMAEGGLEVYRDLENDGLLDARITVLILAVKMSRSFEEFAENLRDLELPTYRDARQVNIVGVKIMADGIPPNRTSWMHEPFVGGGCGGLTVGGDTDPEREATLRQMIVYAHSLGYQVGVHITGDRGIDAVVDSFADAVRQHPRTDTRHYVIHGDFMTPHSLEVCREFGFGVNMNPTIKWTIADLEEEFVGAERAAYEFPYRSTLDSGVRVTSGSDAPVTFPDWRQGVSTMVLRESKASSRVSGADQCITVMEALRTYTIDAAWQDFAESWKGSLEVGKVADLCVVDGDLLSIDPHDIPSAPVLLTAIGGRIVHDAL